MRRCSRFLLLGGTSGATRVSRSAIVERTAALSTELRGPADIVPGGVAALAGAGEQPRLVPSHDRAEEEQDADGERAEGQHRAGQRVVADHRVQVVAAAPD